MARPAHIREAITTPHTGLQDPDSLTYAEWVRLNGYTPRSRRYADGCAGLGSTDAARERAKTAMSDGQNGDQTRQEDPEGSSG